ncbi:MAG TPA: 50S ribosomal protein L24 [Candidatus Bathyarchaeia archaeon]|nr:50S ribosomal protein L24 [Candidatus Bathyarchaeia archaeon]
MVVVTKPGAQRKRLFQAPLSQRYKHFSAPLSAELKKSRSTNSLPVRAGDTVKVVRGDRKGIEGKVSKIDRKKYRISIEGVTRDKVDGTAIPVLIHPSKVMIINLNLDDKWRRKILDRKQKKVEATQKPGVQEKAKKKEAKKPRTRKKVVEKKEEQEKKARRKTTKKIKAEKNETAGE